MNIYSPYRRFIGSISAAAALFGLYLVVRVISVQFLDVERTRHEFTQQKTDFLPGYQQDAERWFPGFPWVATASNHFRDNGQFLLCNSLDLMSDGKSVVAKPIAMLWRSNPEDKDEVPVTLVAESAQLNRSVKFLDTNSSLGRITSGTIYGRVRIDGPRGLRITGDLFNLSEDSMMLWSNNRVDFVWEGHTGYSTKGVEIHLHSSGTADAGLTSVTDISKVKLLGTVVCNVSMPGRSKGDNAVDVKIQAPGGFSFDVPMKTAKFSGLPRGNSAESLKARDEVWIRQTSSDGNTDHLVCPELKLQFRNEISTVDGSPIEGSMQLEHVIAWGRRVVFLSAKNDLRLYANQLQYFLDERRIDIRNTGTTGDLQQVVVKRADTTLEVPHIQIRHDKDGALERVECNGAGSINSVFEPPSTADATDSATEAAMADQMNQPLNLNATWFKSMVVQMAPDGLTRMMKLEGNASVAEEIQNFRLSGETIAMRLFSGPADEQKIGDKDKANSDASLSAAEFDFANLQPELLTAVGNVSLSSPQGDGVLRDKLTVRFENAEAVADTRDDNPIRTVSASDSTNPFSKKASAGADDSEKQLISFVSDTLEAVVKVGEKNSMQFQDLWLKGDVEVIRQALDDSEGFTAKGNQLYAKNGLKSQREIQLFGDPARVMRDTGNLEGPRIDFRELDGMALVPGNGRIRFVTDKTLDGKPLAKPMPIDIYWSEHMHFQKRSADFVGNIRVVMDDGVSQSVEILCAGLTVHFAKEIALGPKEQDGSFATILKDSDRSGNGSAVGNGQIERIECHSKVTVKIAQTLDGVASGRYDVVVADLVVNLQSGDFSATGPGRLESVSPDKEGKLQGTSPAVARANSPAQTSETAFVYTQTEFIGELTGNLQRREARLSQNVVALVAPVRRVDEKIDIRNVPVEDLPENAGILKSEYLTISGIDESEDSPQSFALVARQNAGLWSRSISAGADVITYDHSKQQFIMRADGDGQVTVNHRAGSGNRFNQFNGNRFEYYRRTNQLKGDRIRGLDYTRQGSGR